MRNEAIAKLIKEFKALSISEREKFIDFISANSSPSDFKFIVDAKLADGIVCPYCGAKGKGVCKNGVHSNGYNLCEGNHLLLHHKHLLIHTAVLCDLLHYELLSVKVDCVFVANGI